MSGMISDMLTASMAKHSRVLVENRHFNGHPDLLVQGRYPQNSVRAGEHGIEIKVPARPVAQSTPTVRAISGCAFLCTKPII